MLFCNNVIIVITQQINYKCQILYYLYVFGLSMHDLSLTIWLQFFLPVLSYVHLIDIHISAIPAFHIKGIFMNISVSIKF